MFEKNVSLTSGSVAKGMLVFAIPIFFSNLFQQLYNAVDSLIVGNFLGGEALAAVGSSGSLIFLLTGFVNGVSLGAGVGILLAAQNPCKGGKHRGKAATHKGKHQHHSPPDADGTGAVQAVFVGLVGLLLRFSLLLFQSRQRFLPVADFLFLFGSDFPALVAPGGAPAA